MAIGCELGQARKGAAAAVDSGAVIRLATTFLVFEDDTFNTVGDSLNSARRFQKQRETRIL